MLERFCSLELFNLNPFLAPIPKNAQTHSNHSPATADELFEVVDHFVELALERIIVGTSGIYSSCSQSF